MTPESRTKFCNSIKSLLKKKIKRATTPHALLPTLPRRPAELKASQPKLYEEAFGESSSAPKLPMSEVVLSQTMESTKWRLHPKAKPARASSFDSGLDGMQSMGERIGEFMIKGLAQVMQWQQGRMQAPLQLTFPARGQHDVVLRGQMQQQRNEQQARQLPALALPPLENSPQSRQEDQTMGHHQLQLHHEEAKQQQHQQHQQH